MKGYLKLLLIFVLVSLFAQCQAKVKVCKKRLKGKFDGIKVRAKGTCILNSVKANTVTVQDGGNLTVKGISTISEISALDGAIIILTNRTSVDTITATDSASITVTVEKTSFVESLILSEAGNTNAQGPFGTIESKNSGALNVASSTVNGSILVQGGKGAVRICGSTIKKRTVITSRKGRLNFGNLDISCSGSRFEGKLAVAKGGGSVTLQSSFARIVSIGNRNGNVSLSLSSLGPVSVKTISGDVTIATSTARRAISLEDIAGALTLSQTAFFGSVVVAEAKPRAVGDTTIKESSFQESTGDVRLSVERRGRLTISNTNFFEGTAVLKANTGPVTFNGNADVNVRFARDRRLRIFENNAGTVDLTSCKGFVIMEKNVIRSGKVESCSARITIRQNVFRKLRCFKNTPAPVGGENAISKSATGQCAKFKS